MSKHKFTFLRYTAYPDLSVVRWIDAPAVNVIADSETAAREIAYNISDEPPSGYEWKFTLREVEPA